jgi:hypothetical protein
LRELAVGTGDNHPPRCRTIGSDVILPFIPPACDRNGQVRPDLGTATERGPP